VADTQRENPLRGHEPEPLRAGLFGEQAAVAFERKPRGDLHRRPEPVFGAGGGAVRRAHDDVAGEGILLEHVIERRIQVFLGHLPGDERALREIRRDQRLAHAPHCAGGEHRTNAFEHGAGRRLRALGYLQERLADEPLYPCPRDGEDSSR